MAKHLISLTNPDNVTHSEPNRENTPAVKEPLSGSKQVKNRNHSRQNHGEGS